MHPVDRGAPPLNPPLEPNPYQNLQFLIYDSSGASTNHDSAFYRVTSVLVITDIAGEAPRVSQYDQSLPRVKS